MPYGTVNADVIQTSTSGGILGAGNASIMKNRIINGAMVIDQRNAGASVTQSTSVVYTLDRFNIFGSVASKFTCQQNAGSVTPPVGFSKYLGITSSSAYTVGASEVFRIAQPIEGFNTADLAWGTANAKTVTLSFQVYSSLTGTFGGSLTNENGDRSYPFTYTISSANTWTSASVTIAGDTSGTWVGATNGVGIYLFFGLGVGSTNSGTAGSWASANYRSATGAVSVVGTSGATFYITGVQLEIGSSATGFEYVNYQTSLANCQRYFQTIGCMYFRTYQSASTYAGSSFTLPVNMRSTPTAATVGTITYSNTSSLTLSPDGVGTYNYNAVDFYALWGSAGDGRVTINGSGNYMTFSAEL
jgi:hypothetical protein